MAVPQSTASSADDLSKLPPRSHSLSYFLQIGLAFATVFFPLFLIATLLCLFVTLPIWTLPNTFEENPNLPIRPVDSSFFLTLVLSNKVSLTSSFASNIAQFAAAPFLLLFSFLVALELAKGQEDVDQDTTRLVTWDPKFLLSWAVLRVWRKGNGRRARGTRVAGIGALISIVLTVLLVVGDKLLQGTIAPTLERVYDDNFFDATSDGSFRINSTICPHEQVVPDIYDRTAPPPCSIYNTSPWTLRGASTAYRVLATGLLNQTRDYHNEDFDTLNASATLGIFEWMQLVTHIDPATSDQHVFLFDPSWAWEDSKAKKHSKFSLVDNAIERLGFDYIANTTSVVTSCEPITAACGMRNSSGSGTSIPYHCSDSFFGDLNEIPSNGLERLKGWNTTFYSMDNGAPRNISTAAQLNPFHFNVTVVVDSINIEGLSAFGDPQVTAGTVVGTGAGRVGFAISCTSTVYDVTYALVDGNTQVFNKTLASSRTAAIVKAPLQAGFGSYSLFEKAAMSILFTNLTVMDSMELTFSQTFLALAAGVYERAPLLQQRWRGDVVMTKVGKGSFCFLVVCMFLYAAVVLVFTIIALSIFWKSDVREVHARLIMKERVDHGNVYGPGESRRKATEAARTFMDFGKKLVA